MCIYWIKKKKYAIFHGSSLVEKIFRNVARINPKGTPGSGRHPGSYKVAGGCAKGALLAECVHIDASTEPEIPGPTSSHFLRPCQGSRLAAAGCQAHNLDRVQRRVWTTQEISVQFQSGGRIALLGSRVRRCKYS